MLSRFFHPVISVFALHFLLAGAAAHAGCAGVMAGKSRVLSQALSEGAQFTKDGKKILFIGTDQAFHPVLMIARPEVPSVKPVIVDAYPGLMYPELKIVISPDGKYVIFVPPAKYKAVPAIYDVAKERFDRVPELADVDKVRFSADSRYVSGELSGGSVRKYNLAKKTVRTNKRFSEGLAKNTEPKSGEVVLSPDKKYGLSYEPFTGSFSGGTYVLHDYTKLAEIAELPLPEDLSMADFQRLGVPGAFDLEKNARAVLYYFDSGMFRESKSLAQKLLLNVLSKSTDFYESLIVRYPEFLKDDYYFTQKNISKTDSRWIKAMNDYLDLFRVKHATPEKIVESMKYLRPLKNYLAALSSSRQNDFAVLITEALAEAASHEFVGVHRATFFKYAEQVAYPLFGFPYKPIFSVEIIRTPHQIEFVYFGSELVRGFVSTKTPYGFYAKRFSAINIAKNSKVGDQVIRQKISWQHGKDEYDWTANAKVKALSMNSYAPKGKKPDAGKLLKDKELNGVIVVASNLGAEDEVSRAAYIDFYTKNEFVFDEHATLIDDAESYVKGLFTGNNIDYIITDGHANGDASTIAMRLFKRAKIIMARRPMANGFSETIRIVFPTDRTDDYLNPNLTSIIHFNEVGEWMKVRKSPLFIFNTECWSFSKLISWVEGAGTEDLIPVVFEDPVDMFFNSPDHSMLQWYNAFRRLLLPYSKWHKNMEINPDYVHGTGNTLTTPDDEVYKEELNKANPPLQWDINFKKNGREKKVDE